MPTDRLHLRTRFLVVWTDAHAKYVSRSTFDYSAPNCDRVASFWRILSATTQTPRFLRTMVICSAFRVTTTTCRFVRTTTASRTTIANSSALLQWMRGGSVHKRTYTKLHVVVVTRSALHIIIVRRNRGVCVAALRIRQSDATRSQFGALLGERTYVLVLHMCIAPHFQKTRS
jgi:hypothetical protein